MSYRLPVWVVALAAVVAAAGARQESGPAEEPSFAFPGSPVGRAAEEYLAAYNGLDGERVRGFIQGRFSDDFLRAVPTPQLLAFHRQCWSQLGRLAPKALLSADGDSLAVAVQSEQGAKWLRLDIDVAAQPPHKITGLTIRPSGPPESANKRYDDWRSLAELAQQAGPDSGAPGLALAVVCGGEVLDGAVWGVRALGQDDAVRRDDAFHVGSVTKSITATMLAALVERGTLRWDMTLAEVLPDVPMRAEYRGVTIEQLLGHRGGIVPHLTFNGAEMGRLVNLPGAPAEQRAAYVREVLQLEPIGPAGGESRYSNAGYAIAGHIAERVTKREWSQLVDELVFKPLKLTTAGFGWPATPARPDRVRGHFGEGNTARVQGLTEYDLGAFGAPAGNVHASVGDLARYAALHLRGLRGRDGLLKAETIRRLHSAPGGGAGYAYGWVIEDAHGARVHWHNGTAGTFYCLVTIYPEDDLAVVVALNAATSAGEPLARRLAETVRAHRARLPARAP